MKLRTDSYGLNMALIEIIMNNELIRMKQNLEGK